MMQRYSKILHYINLNIIFFEGNEYLLGDGAYPISKTMIVPFRNAQRHPHTTLIAIERAFGRLKGTFQALRELRVKKAKHGAHMVDVALILHNFIERDGDHWDEESDVHDNIEDSGVEMEHTTSRSLAKTEGERKRLDLMKTVLQSHGYYL